jgi:hypothetical protein
LKKDDSLKMIIHKKIQMKKIFFITLIAAMLPLSYSITLLQVKPALYKRDTFIVEEYPIEKKYLNSLPKEILEKRKQWRERLAITEEDMIGSIHTKIKPLGYQFMQIWGMMAWNFMKGDEVLAKELYDIQGFSMDKQQKNFVFLAKQRSEKGEVFVFAQNNKIQKITKDDKMYNWFYWYKFYPFYIENDLICCEVTDKGHAFWEGAIRNQNELLYNFSFTYGAGGMPVHFSKIDESWLLEIFEHEHKGRIIIDGEDVRQKYSCSGMWGYCSIKNKAFFFFTNKEDNKYRMSYNGKEVPDVWYDFVGYNGAWGVMRNDTMIWFYAMRGEQFYYVEAGIY